MRTLFHSLAVLSLLGTAGPGLRADEGMWTFDNLPLAQMKAKYDFAPDQAWIDHQQRSALRFPHGSGAFVSAEGLVLTNHHVGHEFIHRISDKDHDYIKDGFVAAGRDQELRVPGLELRSLVSFENITARIEEARKNGLTRQEAVRLFLLDEKQRTQLDCESVSLYQGGEEWVYRYKVFTDVRLVLAPEFDIAAFGKDWDNFSYPRHDLDFSLWRVYENGQPYRPADYLKWSAQGAAYGDLSVVVGHPGRTSRLETLAQIQFRRDHQSPLLLRSLDRHRKALRDFAAKNAEFARQASSELMGTENAHKVYEGELLMLRGEEALLPVRRAEEELKRRVASDPTLKQQVGKGWARIESLLKTRKDTLIEERLLAGRSPSLIVDPVEAALKLLKAEDADLAKELPELEGKDLDLQILLLATGLREAQEELGAAHPLVKALLGARTPEAVAEQALKGTKLLDPDSRKALLEGGSKALKTCPDPLLQLARQLEPFRTETTKRLDKLTAELTEQNVAIAKARFAVYGKSVYPDATFTLRLSYGALATYPTAGTLAQPFTTFGGLYDRADAWGPKAEGGSWALPPRWIQKRAALNPSTPYNFISNNDIIGGNSGSPVVNRKGELIGLAFDGNIESHLGRYTFNPVNNRCLCVDTRAILESLAKVYEAPALVEEIQK
jgi:hypothetical protein